MRATPRTRPAVRSVIVGTEQVDDLVVVNKLHRLDQRDEIRLNASEAIQRDASPLGPVSVSPPDVLRGDSYDGRRLMCHAVSALAPDTLPWAARRRSCGSRVRRAQPGADHECHCVCNMHE